MGRDLGTALQQFERFLRIDRLVRTSDIIRARAVYVIALLFLASQVVNFALLNYTYGYWTHDHWVASGVVICVTASLVMLRCTKKFVLFAGFYSLLVFAGILSSALHDHTGINTALMSFFVLGAVINGFISGWRTVLVYGLATIFLIWYLYSVSTSAPTGALFDTDLFRSRNLQRAIQATIAFGLVSLFTAFASFHMHSAFFILEEKIAQVEKAANDKSQFLANLSHELRTPLNGILGFSALLTKTSLSTQQGRYAAIVNKSADSLLSIVNDTLDISKIDAGKFEFYSQRFDLHTMMQSLINLYQPISIGKGLLLGMRYPNDLAHFYYGDEKRIRQIINNLVSNAVKFTEHGSVYLTVEKNYDITSDNNITLSVIDTGIGIADNNKDIIFEKFSQIDNSLSSKTEGTGLGLALCRKIVTLMGGSMSVESQMGAGSTFACSLNLPISDNQNETTEKAEPSQQCEQKEDVEFEIITDNFDDEAA